MRADLLAVGLSHVEVGARRARGEGNRVRLGTSRPYPEIFRTNLLNPINILVFSIGAVQIAIGRFGDAAASVGIILFNVVVGIVQEVRAKRQLDRIALLTRPKVSVLRERQESRVDPSELVKGDLIVVRPGDQFVVDGTLVSDGGVQVDESLLTGESDHVCKAKGDRLLSASFCVAGQGIYEATQVGEETYANRLTRDARRFQLSQTPLQREIDLILRLLLLLAAFIGGVTLIGTIVSAVPLMRQVQMAAIIAGLIPNGLFFMVILAYAMGALRIARGGALVQQTNAVESLSNVTVLCTDKTGTLTANKIVMDRLFAHAVGEPEMKRLLADYSASTPSGNGTDRALRAALPGTARRTVDQVPFSSSRKWSALAFREGLQGTYVLGALEMLGDHVALEPEAASRAREWADGGLRVLAFARNVDCYTLHDGTGEPVLPSLELIGLVSLREELRPHLQETLAAFGQNGISLKIISGDNPRTVAALAKQAGFARELRCTSGPELAKMDAVAFRQAALDSNIFGRITPDQKERLVEVLAGEGHYVAMIGDGVNDVLSLKKANMGIAMESGSPATRAVANMILLGDSFAALPLAFREGRRIVNGMKDILRLFLTRVLYSALLIIAVSVIGLGFPFVPKHNALLVFLTVGVPTLGLALWAHPGPPPRGAMLREIAHFVLPAAAAVFVFGLFVYIAAFYVCTTSFVTIDVTPQAISGFQRYAGITYDISTPSQFILEVAQLAAQTSLTAFIVFVGLGLVVFVEPPLAWFIGGDEFSGDWRPTLLAGAMLLAFLVILTVPPLAAAFEIVPLPPVWYAAVALVALACLLLLRFAWRGRWLERFLRVGRAS